MKKIILITFIFLFIISASVLAHQPRIGFHSGTINNPVKVEEPEISKAYYGELKGHAEYFKIDSKKELLLYLNILAPDIEGSRTDFIVEVLQDNNVIFTLDNNNWKEFYEPFGGDRYLQGPELEEQVNSGIYLIRVSNSDNLGKYSLAVGKIESFPVDEIIKTFIVLPKLKKDFFEKSPFTAYFNYCGVFLLIILLVLGIIIGLVFYLVKRYLKKKER